MKEFALTLIERFPEVVTRTGEHILLTGVSTLAAVVVGIPVGILCYRKPRWKGTLMSGVGILQTIPSLAMLAILLALLNRIGTIPALVALVLYALLPIVRNTLAGLEGVPPDVRDAARGMGLSSRQRLWQVELPLAEPVILAGIRTAAVVGVGIATLSAFIGAGGLGQFINRGLALSNTTLILLGAVPAAVLALLVDASLAGFAWARTPKTLSVRRRTPRVLLVLALLGPAVVFSAGVGAYLYGHGLPESIGEGSPGRIVRIGSKNFTEQLILGELMAQTIEAQTDLVVERRFNLGGSMICHEALRNGEIDLYAEYTGTALTAILNREVPDDPEEVIGIVKSEYERRFACRWLKPFGFDNTYAIAVRKEDAEAKGWTAISDLRSTAQSLRAGLTSEFAERPDGYPGLSRAYGFEFGEIRDLEPSILYEAIRRNEVEVIGAFATDGRIPAYDLTPLVDDLGFFPPYEAAPVVRTEVLEEHPEALEALARLAGTIDSETMRSLNFQVDQEKRTPSQTVRDFLGRKGIVD